MYIRLIRNKANGSAITGRLVIDGRWFCNTLERVGYQIPALCYPVKVTMSPKFKRLLPLVCGVPQTEAKRREGDRAPHKATSFVGDPAEAMRQGIRFHAGWKPEHSTGCVLVPNRAIEKELTELILKAQKEHEEIILEVIDFAPGTEYGYNTKCPPELQKHIIDASHATERYYQQHPEERKS